MTAATARPVTKAALSAFVREHTDLNLAQSKALTDSLLTEYTVTVKQPESPSSVPVGAGQLWVRKDSRRILRVADVELGPIYVPGDPVASWGPQNVSWEDPSAVLGTPQVVSWRSPDNCATTGTTPINLWRELMRPLPDADAEADTEAVPTPEGDR